MSLYMEAKEPAKTAFEEAIKTLIFSPPLAAFLYLYSDSHTFKDDHLL